MKNVTFLILFSVFFSAVLFTGCKKDDDDQPGKDAPRYNNKTVQIPQTMSESSDPGAQMAVSYINMINGMTSYSAMMTPPGKAVPVHFKDGGTETYTWDASDNSGTYTVTLTVSETDEQTTWDMYITGNMDGNYVTNFHFIHATQSKDETESTFLVYDFNTGNEYMQISWYEMENGSVKFIFEVFNETYLTVVVNSDGSGSIELKEWAAIGYALTYKAIWDATGHGQYWEYENGVQTDKGSW